ncbi:aminotransferase class IV [Maribacter algicola]|uniref:Aminotransferase class IV n=1 Tax=Meishania litoralis TaxID=3434685 RepID=A0ACC7LJY2_9FLAO
MALYPKKVYLNGTIVDRENAQISVFDRGFIFGDGIYEVMVQINGRFFYEAVHLARLDACLKKINIEFEVERLKNAIPKLLEASELTDKDCLLYIQVTRGVAPRQHSFPKNIEPTVMMYAQAKKLPDINTVNASVLTLKDFRWSRCDIKMTSLLGNVMANEQAMQNDRYEALLVRNGIITEASHCNVFFVKDKVVYTHPANEFILDGITRQIVLEICRALNLEVREEGIPLNRISEMDEAFLTGTSTQIASIRQIDDHYFYDGSNIGELTKKLQSEFFKLKNLNDQEFNRH